MNPQHASNTTVYREAMGQLLVLYTQVDRLIMQACAERIATAPDEPASSRWPNRSAMNPGTSRFNATG
jgi:hypothetical protein